MAKSKRCGVCKKDRAATEFPKNARSKDGLQWDCRTCRNTRANARYDPSKKKTLTDSYYYVNVNRNVYWSLDKKRCSGCELILPLIRYSLNRRTKMGLKSICKLCERFGNLRNAYGITKEEFDRRFIEQEGRCPICLDDLLSPHVDHCHETGKVRGLLCSQCNKGLGHMRDSTDALSRAITYLKG